MTEEIEVLYNLVDRLNAKAMESLGEEYNTVFELRTNGEEQTIEFMGMALWCSEPDPRDAGYSKHSGDEEWVRENIEPFIHRQTCQLIDELGKLKEFFGEVPKAPEPEMVPVKKKWMKGVGLD